MAPTDPRNDLAGKYLTFVLGNEEYGLSILKVREIIGIMAITGVPSLPPSFRGVINLRGRVIPIMDLRSRFNMAAAEYTSRTCIVVTEVATGAGIKPFGLVVDSVAEVAQYAAEEIEPPPSLGAEVDSHYLLGMAKRNGQVRILLDIERVVNGQETDALAQAA
ncbi:MAG: chemotaxis protein CheW [Thermodesulfobacteriota bacterium]|jgi:purine-binding chemotaxis protein CheW